MTWYNPSTSNAHYVHNLHRDTDDYRVLGLYIYWNKVTKFNGSTVFVPKSHKLDIDDLENNKIFIESEKGTAFIADTCAWHSGNKVLKDHRYTTNIRFGKDNTYSSIVDGFVLAPTSEQLKFLKP